MGVVVAVLGGYLLGGRRTQFERLYEQRAEVIAELTRRLGRVQWTALTAANPGQPLGKVRLQRIEENKVAITQFIDFFIGHTLWLDEDRALQIDGHVVELANILTEYEGDLAYGQPSSEVGVVAAARIEAMVPDAKQALDARFREIMYPPQWWDGPLRILAGLQRRDRSKRSIHF
jgi:hypothetical protein